ncbi:MAG: S-layer family protein, partial [Proteobacteria bacterium]|nr:S-layer family protein [Pseudomonadota bacterium]
GATGGTDTVTSGSITLSAPSGTVSTGLGLSFGDALLTGTGNSINNVTSGGFSFTTINPITLNSITAGNATFAGTNITSGSINTISSGNISFTSTGGGITGSGVALQTGNVSISGTLPTNTNTQLNSGSIFLTSAGPIGIVAPVLTNPAIITGNVSNTTGTSTGVTANAGNLNLVSAGEINNNTASMPLLIQLGGAIGAATNNTGTLSITTAGPSGNAYISANTPVNLGLSNISQLFNLTAAGNISQAPSTTLSVGGNTTLGVSAPSSNIILGNTGNDLGTTVTFGGNPVDILNVNLDNKNSGALVPNFTGLTNLQNLTLTFENNSMIFTSSITLYNGGSFNLLDTSNTLNHDIDFGSGLSFIAGDNTVTGTNQTVTGGSITASSTGGNILGSSTLKSGAATLNDTLVSTGGTDNVTSGSINLSAPSGTVSTGLALSFGDALLTGTGNSINNVTSGSYSLSATNPVTLGSIITGNATFNATSATGINTITSGNINISTSTISGAGVFTTGNASLTGTISGGSTNINSGNITVSSTGGIGLSANPAIITGSASNTAIGPSAGIITTSGNISLTAAGQIDNNSSSPLKLKFGTASGGATNNSGILAVNTTTGLGNAYINTTASTAPVQLAASSISGVFNLFTAGNISETGVLTVGGTSSFDAGATTNNINLNTQNNDFTGAVSFNNVNNVLVKDINALTLGASNISGNLTVNSGATGAGNLTETGALVVTGTSSFNAGALTNNIDLSTQNNSLTGNVSFTNVQDAALKDIVTLNLAASSIARDLTLNGGADISFVGNTSVGRNLNTNAVGAITETNPLNVTGTSSFNAGATTNNIDLSTQNNDFTGSVSFNNVNNVLVQDINALTLAASTISGNLTVNSGATGAGDLTETGALIVTGTSSFNAGATTNSINLNTQNNDFMNDVSFANVGDVAIRDINALTLAASTISGNLTLNSGFTSAGNLTQTGALSVNGT